MTYTPDKWVIVEIAGGPNPPVYKVLASWYGGYCGSDEWKLSSGILSAEPRDSW